MFVKPKKGFTLIELLVSIAIIAVLSSITMIYFQDPPKEAAFTKLKANWAINEGANIENLIGKWSFDEKSGTTTTDSTDFKNNGTINGATWQEEKDCISGTCLSFDGTDDYVVGNDILYFSTWSYSVWIKRSSDSGSYERIMSYSDGTGYDRWIHIHADDSIGSGYVDTTGNNREVNTTDILDTNQWYYIVSTFDGTNIKMYINGELKATSSDFSSYTPRDNGYPLSIGRLCTSICYFSFNGLIDEPSVYKGAITISEIKSNYLAKLSSFSENNRIIINKKNSLGLNNNIAEK